MNPAVSGGPSLAPDVFGLNPVFESPAGERISHDPQPLAPAPPSLDLRARCGYLSFSHVPTPLSAFSGVKRVAADSPFDSRDSPAHGDFSRDDINTCRELLTASVERNLGGARDVVVFLSGGLDSSLIAALLVQVGARVRALTLDFGAPFDTELDSAKTVAAHLKIPLTIVSARQTDILRAMKPCVESLPQPFGDAPVVPLWLLSRAARDFGDRVYNGEGGDQLFGGWANKPMIAARAQGEQADSPEAELSEYLQTYHRFLPVLDSLWPGHPPFDPREFVAPALDRARHPHLLHRLRAANIALKGAQNIAPRCVAIGNAHRLRVHAPFFDDALAHFTFTLPPSAFLSGAVEKAILKRVAEPLLPGEIVYREKRGMGAPTTHWCFGRHFLGLFVRARLSGRRMKRRGYDPKFVAGLWRGEDPSPGAFRRRRISEKLWCLLMGELWNEVHSLQ